MNARCALTEEDQAIKRQADPALRADMMLMLECGAEVLADSQRPGAVWPGGEPGSVRDAYDRTRATSPKTAEVTP